MKGRNLIQRLTLLSLAIESAVQNDELDCIGPMLTERSELIDKLSNLSPDQEWLPFLASLSEVDERLANLLTSVRTSTATELKSIADHRTGLRKYGDSRRHAAYSQAS